VDASVPIIKIQNSRFKMMMFEDSMALLVLLLKTQF